MDEFPDPEDEYELLHQDEFDLLREQEESLFESQISPKRSRVSLNFNEDAATRKVAPKSTLVSSKRNLSELDLDGIDEIDPPPKKKKLVNQQAAPVEQQCAPLFNKFGVTSLSFPSWGFLTVNTDFGERLYVRVRELDPEDCVNESDWLVRRGQVSESFWKLKQKAVSNLETSSTGNDPEPEDVVLDETVEKSELWVDKFKPKKYLELLSDEGVNRTLLKWIKTWDKVVFHRELAKSTKAVKEDMDNGKFKQFKGKQQIQEERMNEIDGDGRPCYKVALLCGSPGIGKTTLAHVIAVLAGYNVIEVNASDDRSTDAFKTVLENSTQCQSLMGDQKPKCVILDEIDGAPATSIDLLLKFINGQMTKYKNVDKEKFLKVKMLSTRPVICICNELYTPSLRQLRQQAYVIHFPQTSTTKLAQRLLEICKKQDLRTDLSTLTLLCEKTQRDIRSCITTLHFFKARREKAFRASDVSKASLGLKDFQKNLFSVWQEIFHKNLKKDKEFNIGTTVKTANDDLLDYNPEQMNRLHRIIQTVQSAGDYEKLLQGVHENMLKARYPRFQSAIVKALEWFSWTDLLQTRIDKEQNFILMPYIPYAFASWHFLFATTTWPKIGYPSVGYENHLKTTKNKQIVTDVLRGLHPRMRTHAQRSSLVLDVLPLLPTILTPKLRPVNTHLFNDKEKAEFAQLLNVMLDFNINYIQQRSPDGNYYYTFNPSFEEVTHFELKEKAKSNEFSYNMKQLISREVELERVRRNDPLYLTESRQSNGTVATGDKTATPKKSGGVKPPPKPMPVDICEPGQYKDFFGRIVKTQRPQASRSGFDPNNFIKSKVWYCFKEGFNNAVKKDLTIADLL